MTFLTAVCVCVWARVLIRQILAPLPSRCPHFPCPLLPAWIRHFHFPSFLFSSTFFPGALVRFGSSLVWYGSSFVLLPLSSFQSPLLCCSVFWFFSLLFCGFNVFFPLLIHPCFDIILILLLFLFSLLSRTLFSTSSSFFSSILVISSLIQWILYLAYFKATPLLCNHFFISLYLFPSTRC